MKYELKIRSAVFGLQGRSGAHGDACAGRDAAASFQGTKKGNHCDETESFDFRICR
jgi:hypothetical protein